MKAKEIQQLVLRLPESERAEASRRILAAVKVGWIVMGFWECLANYPATQWDLVGFDSSGAFDFLPK